MRIAPLLLNICEMFFSKIETDFENYADDTTP